MRMSLVCRGGMCWGCSGLAEWWTWRCFHPASLDLHLGSALETFEMVVKPFKLAFAEVLIVCCCQIAGGNFSALSRHRAERKGDRSRAASGNRPALISMSLTPTKD